MPSKNMDSAWRPAPDSQPQQGAQSSSEFLWVDCQDGKSQDAAVARNAQAFLQTKYHKMRRQAQLQQLKASMKALPPSKSPSASTPKNETSSEKDDRQLTVIQKDHRVHRSLQPKVEDILPVVSPRVKQSVDFYFDYFRVQGSRRWYPMGQSEMLNCILRQSFDHPSLMEVILSMSAYDYAMKFKAQPQGTSPVVYRSLQDAFYIRSHVIRSIRNLLDKPAEIFSEAAVLLIGHLFVTEALEGNIEAVDAHTDGLRRIVEVLGGVEKIGEWPLANVYSCDPIRGLLKDCPLVFDIPKAWETESLRALSERAKPFRKGHPRLGTSFSHSHIHPRLKMIIRSLEDIICIYEETLRLNIDLAMPDHNCALLLSNRLHSVPFDYALSPFNESIRLTLMLYMLTRMWEFQASVEGLVRKLQDRLEETLGYLESSAPNLLFWILFNGAFASARFECHAWFVSRLKSLARELFLMNGLLFATKIRPVV
ncbi:uncharacterized protein N7496_002059 [Penicillium cataractarum]|uniref:Uncharacterized protein n=1 Tax=Penicillium cataractarum TaxID=2100454 RepID=A0A9W9VX57_9EURO|nr:uncharacterized protein N7496_002059 [Penicillium cataractarum]KAJ5390991.1 hypothetical protein N7496_002059 [Penicillium cataractarum]